MRGIFGWTCLVGRINQYNAVIYVKTDTWDTIFKANVVARGDKQLSGIGSKDAFSPEARMATCWMLFAVCMPLDTTVYQGDISTF